MVIELEEAKQNLLKVDLCLEQLYLWGKLTNAEILENLENLDDAFEIEGKKVLHVLDRHLTLRNTDINIVDRVGHYVFTLSLYDLYGKPYDYELMKDLELRFIEGGSN